jgi:mono/diheme cytochrome c family protein
MSSKNVRLGWAVLGAAVPLASLAVAAGGAEPQPTTDFERDIRPLFAARCLACHGPTLQKSGLRLDQKAGTIQGGDGGKAVIPGKSAESEIILRVTSHDPKKVMPPAGKPLSDREVALLRTWIDQGAPWTSTPVSQPASATKHWSFQPVRRPAVPSTKNPAWVRNPIDAFVLAKLEAKGLKPSPAADRVTLIRRLSLDLLGLPPTPAEVDAFVNDRSPNAYERVVDRLLASPRYGERWGRRWLDEARYADTNGYTIDSPRQIWMYRDWVINALNADLPFDQFTIDQLAGDLEVSEEMRKQGNGEPAGDASSSFAHLPLDLRDKLIATGFHRNTMINEEGGTDKEQFRVEAVVDRVNTTASVWLGLTVGCAQCHTHKFDPITQREYYQFFAFFNSQEEPSIPFATPEQERERDTLKERLAATQRELKSLEAGTETRQAAWEARAGRQLAARWNVLSPVEARSAAGATLTELDDHSLLVGGTIPNNDTYTVTVQLPERATALRLEALTHESLPDGGPGLAGGNFLLTEFSVARQQPSAGPVAVPIVRALADHSQQGYPVTLAVDGKPATGWAINVKAGEGSLHTDRTALFLFQNPITAGTRLMVTLRQEHPNKRYLVGRFRLAAADVPPQEVEFVPTAELRALLSVPAGQRTTEQRQRLTALFRTAETAHLTTTVAEIQARQKELEKEIPSTMVLRERETPRETFVHLRGDFLRPGPRVEPGTLAVLNPLSTAAKAPTRLDLARWIVDPQNPLTARVAVNRVWQGYFGTGLVETENDFGTQGTPPSHPELLDWLAVAFMSGDEKGARREVKTTALSPLPASLPTSAKPWSLKRLHRLIVTSNTYKQSSHARPELQEIDPNNRLLARQNRIRLDGELIRDISLAASGLLSTKMGGPGVYPPQPAGTDLFTQVKRAWTVSEGEDRYRRGVYTWQWRSNPYPLFTAFDAPSGNVTCTRRSRSNTPTQALMLANDQSLIELAQGLATRLLREGPASDPERVRYAFRRCLSREPSAIEASRLLAYYRSQLAGFQTAPRDAEAIAPKDRPAASSAPEAAAWAALARVLMNVDEFITRE